MNEYLQQVEAETRADVAKNPAPPAPQTRDEVIAEGLGISVESLPKWRAECRLKEALEAAWDDLPEAVQKAAIGHYFPRS